MKPSANQKRPVSYRLVHGGSFSALFIALMLFVGLNLAIFLIWFAHYLIWLNAQ